MWGAHPALRGCVDSVGETVRPAQPGASGSRFTWCSSPFPAGPSCCSGAVEGVGGFLPRVRAASAPHLILGLPSVLSIPSSPPPRALGMPTCPHLGPCSPAWGLPWKPGEGPVPWIPLTPRAQVLQGTCRGSPGPPGGPPPVSLALCLLPGRSAAEKDVSLTPEAAVCTAASCLCLPC